MIPVWEVDDDGNIIEHYLMTEKEYERALFDCRHVIDFPWGEPFFRPIFNFDTGQWIEGMSLEEIEEIKRNQPPPEPTLEDLKAENNVLKSKLESTESRLETAEMAIITLMDFI
jgi:hypothetical protein